MFHVKRLLLIFLIVPVAVFSQHMGMSSFEVKKMPPLPPLKPSLNAFLDQFEETSALTPRQKEWFYWTNYSRENPKRFWDSVIAPLILTFPSLDNSYSTSLKKELYNSPPLSFVRPNISLIKASTKLALELSAKSSIPSHTSPSGSTFKDRMQQAAIKRCAGENISFGPDNPVFMLVLLYIDEGVPAMGHRKTLLDPAFVEMGIGISNYPDNKVMVIQDFACNQK